MKLSQLATLLQGELVGPDRIYCSVSLDSRRVMPGELFIALSGERFDGHLFMDQARSRGAVAAIIDKAIPAPSSFPVIRVSNTRKALAQLAQFHREQFSIPLIALTGSCGKTTTKEMLRAILSECGEVLASSKSFNNDIGVPLSLLQLTAQHRFAVIEMGANHPGEIAYLTRLARPTIALITNIAPAHLEGFGSIESVAQAKSEIFLGLSSNGVAIVNNQKEFMPLWSDCVAFHPLIRFGLEPPSDFSAKDIHLDKMGCIGFSLITPEGACSIRLSLVGQHHLFNALAAAAAATSAGASLTSIKKGLEKMQSLPGRLMLLKGKQGACIIDDSYNANPYSVASALQWLVHYPGQSIFVMGEMSELGEKGIYYHQKIGKLAKKLGVHSLFACGELTRFTVQTFGERGQFYRNQEDLIKALGPLLRENINVLVKGSRRAQMEKVVVALTGE